MSYDEKMKKAMDLILNSLPNDSRKIARDIAKEADKEIVGLKEILLDCHNSASSLNDWQLVFRINNAIE